MQDVLAGEVIDVLAASAQEAQVLEAFDGAPDQRIDRSHLVPAALAAGFFGW